MSDYDWRATLRDKGYRLTPQRELILSAVDTLGHATPDEVLAEVRKHSVAVNVSTVYRTLEVLEELGLVRHAHLSDKASTYHSVRDHEHFHLVCRNCHKVVSVDPEVINPLVTKLDSDFAFTVDVGHLTVFGACKDCHHPSVTSPLLDLPGAVAGDGIDAPVAAHYGSFNREQRALVQLDGFVDLSHRDVVRLEGPDRLTWLHSLTTQHLTELAPGTPTQALILSPQGHVEHAFRGTDDGTAFTLHTEPGRAAALIEFLERMKFMTRVEITDVTDELAVTWRPSRAPEVVEQRGTSVVQTTQDAYELVPRDRLAAYAEAAGPAAGTWAFEALRIARGEPRFGIDTDHRTIPNEVGWIGSAVHLDKGCYRGQETVARVHTLGRPPRRLTLLHLDGTENRLPRMGAEVLLGAKSVGFVGSSARHHELGPIALGAGQAQRRPRRGAHRRRHAGDPGGRGRPRGRPACPTTEIDAGAGPCATDWRWSGWVSFGEVNFVV